MNYEDYELVNGKIVPKVKRYSVFLQGSGFRRDGLSKWEAEQLMTQICEQQYGVPDAWRDADLFVGLKLPYMLSAKEAECCYQCDL